MSEPIQEKPIAIEDQLPHDLVNVDAEIIECKSLVVDVRNGLHNAKVWIDGHETYVNGVEFELGAGRRPTARISFMPKKLVLRWVDPEGRTHIQAAVDNRIVGEWPAERIKGHPTLVFDLEDEETDDANQTI